MTYKMYIGGYSSDNSSIYEVHFDPEINELKVLSVNNESLNPVHIKIKDDILFSANELDDVARVSSFKINDDGSLSLIDRLDGDGHQTCDITVDDDVLYAANYGSGNIFSVVFDRDGTLIERMSNLEHIGVEPRSHSTILSKNGKYLYEANLGLDRIFNYEVYPEGIVRTNPTQNSVKLDDNEGPRHMSISPDGKMLYIVNEFGNSVYSFSINEENGNLTKVDYVTLTDNVASYGSDIHFDKDGKYIYVGLRGSDEIHLLVSDEGRLSVKGIYTTGGKSPRSFAISNDNKYLFVTNQFSDSVVALNIDQNTGALSKPLASVEIFRPTTVVIYDNKEV